MELNIDLIQKVLPHRYPFLLVDRVLEVGDGHAKGLKNVTFNEEFFNGHFPGKPIMPGVLQIEAMAQVACFMAYYGLKKGKPEGWEPKLSVFFAGIDGVRFRRVVIPGDQLIIETNLTTQKRNFWWMEGKITVDGELACEAMMSAIVQDENK
ncbi:MAG: 3-hydroxyacyl-ACP dehydratase FabZ [Deferribacteraceae bacterium]|jgi:3-hydroxyacyl-[acyl-carrier-protein] dehydratase|nr:3-hydroxyacyl-ACP dehydratase FabZ [Deferribacteraceae bacterium]